MILWNGFKSFGAVLRIRIGWKAGQLTQDVYTGFIESCFDGKRGECRLNLNSEQGMMI